MTAVKYWCRRQTCCKHRDAGDLLAGGIDAGKKSGFRATIFGAAQLIMGNAVPGLVLGILIGKGVEEQLEPGD